MVPPKNTTAQEGTRVKLNCQAEGYPNNISYRWYRDGVDVQHMPGLMPRAGIYADGSFVISSVIKEDTGWYKCRPTNGLGPAPEAQAYLNVTCKLVTLLQVYIKVFITLRLRCVLTVQIRTDAIRQQLARFYCLSARVARPSAPSGEWMTNKTPSQCVWRPLVNALKSSLIGFDAEPQFTRRLFKSVSNTARQWFLGKFAMPISSSYGQFLTLCVNVCVCVTFCKKRYMLPGRQNLKTP